MRRTKVSCKSQLYSEYQTFYTLRIKKSHIRKVFNHKGKSHAADKPYVSKISFSIKIYKQITIVSYNE